MSCDEGWRPVAMLLIAGGAFLWGTERPPAKPANMPANTINQSCWERSAMRGQA